VENRLHVIGRRGITQAHHRAFAELLFDLAQCGRSEPFLRLSSISCFPSVSVGRGFLQVLIISQENRDWNAHSERVLMLFQ